MTDSFAPNRYDHISSRRCGASGLHLPVVALGGWRTVGGYEASRVAREIFFRAFDHGIYHFDFANNYGNPAGHAEEVAGTFLRDMPRHELVVSSKAGYLMWPGPHGDFGSRKYLIQSCEQSLRRLGFDHVDLFYHHRPDPDTPLEESMGALNSLVQQGKALYVGISNYPADRARAAVELCRERGWAVPIINQVRYSMTARAIEEAMIPAAPGLGLGLAAFSPLDRGTLSTKYLAGTPEGARANSDHPHDAGVQRLLSDERYQARIRALLPIAEERGQELPEMALSWCMRHPAMTTVLTAASRPEQLDGILRAATAAPFTGEELSRIDSALAG